MSTPITKGNVVSWKMGITRHYGRVLDTFTDTVTRTIKGDQITLQGSPEDPILLIEDSMGAEILKAQSEVEVETETA